MANWREHLNVHAILGQERYDGLDDYDPIPDGLRKELADEINRSARLPKEELLEALEMRETIEDLNDWLAELYDTANARLVWLGLPG